LAGSIEEEKDILKEIIPDLIFLDIHLPDGNGLEELQRLKPYGPGCKVIMMSAFDHSEEQKDAYDSGAIAFLSKPFSLSRLNQVIDSRFNISTKSNKENGPNISN
jgi:response regulator of citrate/malate metabolism